MRHVFSGFGRENMAYKVPENAEAGSLEVIDTRTGNKVYTGSIPKEIAGNMLSVAEFFVDIEDDGWALRPLIRETSGDEKTRPKSFRESCAPEYCATFPAANTRRFSPPEKLRLSKRGHSFCFTSAATASKFK